MSRPRASLLLLLFSLMAGLAAISTDSLWIDEGNSASKAVQPTFSAFAERLREDGGSDVQMPLYMVWLWGWARCFGTSEVALRMASLPWFLLGQGALLGAARRGSWFSAGTLRLAVAAGACSPFLWIYLNEARPYVLQYSGGCLLLAWLAVLAKHPARGWATGPLLTGLAGGWLTAGSSLLGIPVVGAVFLAAAYRMRRCRPGKRAVALGTGFALGMAVLGAYYFLHRAPGGGASPGVNRWDNLLFAGYEMLGLGGFGPGRLALRENAVAALHVYRFPLGIGAMLIGLPLLLGGWGALRSGRLFRHPLWLWVVLLPAGIILAGGIVGHVRLLGRHFMPLYPFLLVVLAGLLRQTPRQPVFPALFLGAWLFSALQLRWAPAHRRDDYRTAAHQARATLEHGGTVWWMADRRTGEYYGLRFSTPGLVLLRNPDPSELATAPAPTEVWLSKADLYDGGETARTYLTRQGYAPADRLPAFTRWQKENHSQTR